MDNDFNEGMAFNADAHNLQKSSLNQWFSRNYWQLIVGNNYLLTETIDFWHDRNFHGKLDPAGNAIFLSETNLKQFKKNSRNKDVVFGIDFVVDAFSDLQLHFTQAQVTGKLSPEGNPELINVEAKTGWISVHQSYNEYLVDLYDSMVGKWFKADGREQRIRDLPSFVKMFMELMIANNGYAFLSMSGLITSKLFPNTASGLVLELTHAPERVRHGRDSHKVEWITDPNYLFYKSAAENHGFMIDKNAPWRLVADINHPTMQKHMQGMNGAFYGVTSDNLFDKYYYRSYEHDLENLRDFFFGAYNAYCNSYPAFSKPSTCVAGSTVKTRVALVERQTVDPEAAYALYPDEYWLELYYFIRLRELGAPLDSAYFHRQVRKIIQFYRKFGLDNSKKYVNMLIRHTRSPNLL